MTNGEPRPYDIYMAPSALKIYNKFPESLKDKIKKEASIIAIDPYSCKELSEPLKGIRSRHFSFSKTKYRIAYRINESSRRIEIVLVRSRENFYERLSRIFK